MKGFFCRLYGFYGKEFKEYVKSNRIKIILLCIFTLFSILFGFLVCNKYRADIEESNVINIFIVKIISSEISLISSIGLHILITIIIVVFLYVLSENFILKIVLYVLYFLLCYIVGFDMCAVSTIYAFFGTFYVIICLPFVLIIIFIFMILIVYFSALFKDNCRIGYIVKYRSAYVILILLILFVTIIILNCIFFTIRLFIVSN